MPSFSAILNQLSGAPLSSDCSHKPAAVGSLLAGAAQAAAFRQTTAATTLRSFVTVSRTPSGVPGPVKSENGELACSPSPCLSCPPRWSSHQHVLELPRIVLVNVLREQPRPARKRGPVGVLAEH